MLDAGVRRGHIGGIREWTRRWRRMWRDTRYASSRRAYRSQSSRQKCLRESAAVHQMRNPFQRTEYTLHSRRPMLSRSEGRQRSQQLQSKRARCPTARAAGRARAGECEFSRGERSRSGRREPAGYATRPALVAGWFSCRRPDLPIHKKDDPGHGKERFKKPEHSGPPEL